MDRLKIVAPKWDSDKDPKGFRKFAKDLANLVRSCKGGSELSNYVEEKLGITHQTDKCIPSFIKNDPDFIPRHDGAYETRGGARREVFGGEDETPIRSGTPMRGNGDRSPRIEVLDEPQQPRGEPAIHPLLTPRSSTRIARDGTPRSEAYYKATKSYNELSTDTKELDSHMYSILQMSIDGTWREILDQVTFPSYAQAIILLTNHNSISSNTRKTEALEAMESIKMNGSVQQWVIDTVGAYQELKDSKVTIDDVALYSIVKSLQGRSKYVQHEIVKEINEAGDGTPIQVYDLVQKYATQLAAVDGVVKPKSTNHVSNDDSSGVNSIQDVVCHGCGEKGHFIRECPNKDKSLEKPGDGLKTRPKGKHKWPCSKCGSKDHKRSECPKKGEPQTQYQKPGVGSQSNNISNGDILKMLKQLNEGKVTNVAVLSPEEVKSMMADQGIEHSNFDDSSTQSCVVQVANTNGEKLVNSMDLVRTPVALLQDLWLQVLDEKIQQVNSVRAHQLLGLPDCIVLCVNNE